MTEITIYHNQRCAKSRDALALLRDKDIEPNIRFYLEAPLSEKELRQLLKKLSIAPFDLIRKNEKLYKEKYKGKTLSNNQWIKVLAEEPKLMERPVVEHKSRAVIARPPERVLELL